MAAYPPRASESVQVQSSACRFCCFFSISIIFPLYIFPVFVGELGVAAEMRVAWIGFTVCTLVALIVGFSFVRPAQVFAVTVAAKGTPEATVTHVEIASPRSVAPSQTTLSSLSVAPVNASTRRLCSPRPGRVVVDAGPPLGRHGPGLVVLPPLRRVAAAGASSHPPCANDDAVATDEAAAPSQMAGDNCVVRPRAVGNDFRERVCNGESLQQQESFMAPLLRNSTAFCGFVSRHVAGTVSDPMSLVMCPVWRRMVWHRTKRVQLRSALATGASRSTCELADLVVIDRSDGDTVGDAVDGGTEVDPHEVRARFEAAPPHHLRHSRCRLRYFTAANTVAALHRASHWGRRPLLLFGDSNMRQLFFRVVAHVRGLDRAVDYHCWCDAAYVVREHGDELWYDDGARRRRPACDPNSSDDPCLFSLNFAWRPHEGSVNHADFFANLVVPKATGDDAASLEEATRPSLVVGAFFYWLFAGPTANDGAGVPNRRQQESFWRRHFSWVDRVLAAGAVGRGAHYVHVTTPRFPPRHSASLLRREMFLRRLIARSRWGLGANGRNASSSLSVLDFDGLVSAYPVEQLERIHNASKHHFACNWVVSAQRSGQPTVSGVTSNGVGCRDAINLAAVQWLLNLLTHLPFHEPNVSRRFA